MHDHKLLIESERGFTLIEITIAAGLIGLVALFAGVVIQTQLNSSTMISVQTSRIAIMNVLREEISDVKVLQRSLHQPENTLFLNCVCGSASGCTSGQISPFSLYEPGQVSPQSSYKYYNSNGSACLPTSSNAANCLIQVQTTFLGQCLPALPSQTELPPTSCTSPVEFVGIYILLQQNPAFSAAINSFSPITTAAYTQIADLAPTGSGVCP